MVNVEKHQEEEVGDGCVMEARPGEWSVGLGVLSSSRGRGRGQGQKSLTCSELWRRQRLSRLSTVRLTARKRVAKRARTREEESSPRTLKGEMRMLETWWSARRVGARGGLV